jgi:hypothetical protein
MTVGLFVTVGGRRYTDFDFEALLLGRCLSFHQLFDESDQQYDGSQTRPR